MSAAHLAPALGLLIGWMPLPEWEERTGRPMAESVSAADALDGLQHEARMLLDEVGVEGLLTARVKTPESVAAKAARKGLHPDQVLDRIGLRVCVDGIDDCYAVLDAVHARYAPIVGSQDDYIANPKPNGYQSLHTAVLTPMGVAEFQVRTHGMHHHAESGGAAHDRYKASQEVA